MHRDHLWLRPTIWQAPAESNSDIADEEEEPKEVAEDDSSGEGSIEFRQDPQAQAASSQDDAESISSCSEPCRDTVENFAPRERRMIKPVPSSGHTAGMKISITKNPKDTVAECLTIQIMPSPSCLL